MGHTRLGTLRTTRKWRHVTQLLSTGADVAELAAAVAIAAEKDLEAARGDPVLGSTMWLLAQLPLAARTDRFAAELVALGFTSGSETSILGIVGDFAKAIDSQIPGTAGRTDLGQLARHAAVESLTELVGGQVGNLFDATADDVQIELAKFASKGRFALLARDFFARLTLKTLDYYLSRVLADHVGPDRRFGTLQERERFYTALNQHCREASLIVDQFAAGWFSKVNYQGTLTRGSAQRFTDYALTKMRDELRMRRADDA